MQIHKRKKTENLINKCHYCPLSLTVGIAYTLAAKIVFFSFLRIMYVHYTNTDKNNTYVYNVGKRMIVSELI